MPTPRRGTTNDKSASSLRRGNATTRQHVNAPTRRLTPQQRLDAAARRCNNTAEQYGISPIRHFDNEPLPQCGLRQPACKHPHPTHSAYSTAPAPIHRRNSRTAHTHSHIVHAHSRTPYHMGHAHSHMVPYHMSHAHSHMLPYRMGQTAHPPGSTGRKYMPHAAWAEPMPMSENASMGPHCNDSGFICQKTPEWGPFFLRV